MLVARGGVAHAGRSHLVAPGAGIKRLELTVHTANARAVDLYQRSGFEIEGTRRSSMLVDGVYTDEYLMSLITDIQPLD